MNTWIKYISLILSVVLLCTGCLSDGDSIHAEETTERKIPEDFTEEQLIEIYDPLTDDVLRQITDAASIMEFTEMHSDANMQVINAIPKAAEQVFCCKIYAKTDEFFVKQGVPAINTTEEILYYKDNTYYLLYRVEEFHNKIESSVMYIYQVENTLGEYLIALSEIKSDVVDTDKIFENWGLDEYVSKSPVDQEENRDRIVDKEIVTPDSLAKVSEIQNMRKVLSDGTVVFETEDLEKIAQFYNHLERENWILQDELPGAKDNICTISVFQRRRKTSDVIMVESLRLELYENDDKYYISYVIPETDFSGGMNMFYKIPNEVAQYLTELR